MKWGISTLFQFVETEAQREERTGLLVPGLNTGDLAPDPAATCPEPNLRPQRDNLVAPGHRAEGDSDGTVCTRPTLPPLCP